MREWGLGLVRATVSCSLSAVCLLSGCGGDDAVPFDSISRDKPLVSLSGGEQQGACQWAEGVAKQKIAEKGTPVTCNGIAINVNSCSFPSSAQMNCTATVGQWAACLPSFIDAILADPCKVLDLAFSQSQLETFVNGIPGCEGLGPCSYTIHM